MKIPPTFVDRSWTNIKVEEKVTEVTGKPFQKFSEAWRKQKLKLFGHIARIEDDEDPMQGKDEDLDDTMDDDPEAAAHPGGKGPKPYEKYNKQTKGENKGQPGEPVKMYVKKPPFFCVGFCRYVKTMTCMVDLGPMEDLAAVADMAGVDLNEVAGEVAQSASGIDVNAIRDTVSGASGGVEGAAESAGTATDAGGISSMASDATSGVRDMGSNAMDGASRSSSF